MSVQLVLVNCSSTVQQLIHDTLRNSVSRDSIACQAFVGGLTAITHLRAQPTDMIVTDLTDRFADGTHFLEYLNTFERFQRIPILVIVNEAKYELDYYTGLHPAVIPTHPAAFRRQFTATLNDLTDPNT